MWAELRDYKNLDCRATTAGHIRRPKAGRDSERQWLFCLRVIVMLSIASPAPLTAEDESIGTESVTIGSIQEAVRDFNAQREKAQREGEQVLPQPQGQLRPSLRSLGNHHAGPPRTGWVRKQLPCRQSRSA
jgi:hypothetical protein